MAAIPQHTAPQGSTYNHVRGRRCATHVHGSPRTQQSLARYGCVRARARLPAVWDGLPALWGVGLWHGGLAAAAERSVRWCGGARPLLEGWDSRGCCGPKRLHTRALRAARTGREASGHATRPMPGPAVLCWRWCGGRSRGGRAAARMVAWRRAAFRRAPEAPVVAPEPAKLLRGWLLHWAVDAHHALCTRCGAQGGSSNLLERFPCRPGAPLPVRKRGGEPVRSRQGCGLAPFGGGARVID